jgi:hypothetical protein
MPCTDGGGPRSDRERFRDELPDAFCSVCRALLAIGGKMPSAAKWAWKYHEAQDKERIARENADKERRKLKEAGLSKLTKAERDALGLRGE